MPTYKFKCEKCDRAWEERQNLLFNGKSHMSVCSSCNRECNSISFGGTGTLLKGRFMNRYLECFPDQTNKLNREVDADAIQAEKEHDAYNEEVSKKE